MEEEKFYFIPGMVVTLKHDIPNKPVMYVVRKKTITIRTDQSKERLLQGMICRWFTKDGHLEEAIFSTKDLILI